MERQKGQEGNVRGGCARVDVAPSTAPAVEVRHGWPLGLPPGSGSGAAAAADQRGGWRKRASACPCGIRRGGGVWGVPFPPRQAQTDALRWGPRSMGGQAIQARGSPRWVAKRASRGSE